MKNNWLSTLNERNRGNFNKLIISLPYVFKDKALLKCVIQRGQQPYDFSHLEVVGDALLGAIIKTEIASHHPDWDSGKITSYSQKFLKNTGDSVDDKSVLMSIASNVGLADYFIETGVRLFKGKWGLAHTLSSAVEALIAAVYYDNRQSLEATRRFIIKVMKPFELTPQPGPQPRERSFSV